MLRNASWNGLAEALNLATGTIASVVFVRMLGPQAWGSYSLVLWLAGVLSSLLSGALPQVALRFLSGYQEEAHMRGIVIRLYALQIVIALVGVGGLWFAAESIRNALGWTISTDQVRLGALLAGCVAFINLGVMALRGLQNLRNVALYAALSGTLNLVVIATVMASPHVGTLMVSVVIAQASGAIWLVWRLSRLMRSSSGVSLVKPEEWNSMVRYGCFAYGAVLADQIVWQRSEMFFLARLPTSVQSGYYGLAYTVAQLVIGFLPGALTGTLTAEFSAIVRGFGSTRLEPAFSRAFGFLHLMVFPLAIGLTAISTSLIPWLYGDSYLPVVVITQILVVSTAFAIYARPGASVLHALNRTDILLWSNMAAVPINIGIAYWLVPGHGAIGAAISNVIAQVFGASCIILAAKRLGQLRHNWRSFFAVVVAGLAGGVFAWLGILLLGTSLVSLVCSVLVAVLAYVGVLVVLRDQYAQEGLNWLRRSIAVAVS